MEAFWKLLGYPDFVQKVKLLRPFLFLSSLFLSSLPRILQQKNGRDFLSRHRLKIKRCLLQLYHSYLLLIIILFHKATRIFNYEKLFETVSTLSGSQILCKIRISQNLLNISLCTQFNFALRFIGNFVVFLSVRIGPHSSQPKFSPTF